MRLVLDTNVLVAAYLTRGQCHQLLEHAVRNHELFVSEFILDEFHDTLTGRLSIPADLARAAGNLLKTRMTVTEPLDLEEPVCRDPDDDVVLATAVAARAACLVTGDRDLLALRTRAGIPIVAPSAFWALEAGLEPGSGI